MTNLFYRIMYRLGITPWEEMAALPIAEQIADLFDRAEEGREPSTSFHPPCDGRASAHARPASTCG